MCNRTDRKSPDGRYTRKTFDGYKDSGENDTTIIQQINKTKSKKERY